MSTQRSTSILSVAAVALSLGAFAGCGPSTGNTSANTPSRVTVSDPAGDVWLDKNVNKPYIDAVQPDHTLGDITSLTVEYGEQNVTLILDLVEMPAEPSPHGLDNYLTQIYTPTREYTLLLQEGPEPGRPYLYNAGEDKPFRCAKRSLSFDKENDRLTLSVNRSCLGNPDWVQVLAGTWFGYPGGGDSDSYFDAVPGTGDPGSDSDDGADSETDPPAPRTDRVWWPGS